MNTTEQTLTYTTNIVNAFLDSSPDDVLDGMEWYARAHRLAIELDPNNVQRACGIIAALSPLQYWPVNVANARKVYAGVPIFGLKKNVAKAYAIYNGGAPLDILGGPKVRAFYATILNPAISHSVVVDRHALDIAAGIVQNDADRSAMVKVTKAHNGYDAIASAYRFAAAIISANGNNVSPAELQAITWTYWRRNHAANKHGDI